jgi:hypothetical protein
MEKFRQKYIFTVSYPVHKQNQLLLIYLVIDKKVIHYFL